MYKFKLKDLIQETLTKEQLMLFSQSTKVQILWEQRVHCSDYISANSNLCEISFDTYIITLKAPKSGWYHVVRTRDAFLIRRESTTQYIGMVKVWEGCTLDTITEYISAINICFENSDELLNNFYHLVYGIEEDLYTKEKTIIWNSYVQNIPNLIINSIYEFGKEENTENNNKISLTLLLQNNNTIAHIEYGGGQFYPEINPRTIKHILFLFENNHVIVFSPNLKSATFNGNKLGKWIWELSAEIIEFFATHLIQSIRIESNTESYNIKDIHLINKLCLREYFCQYKNALSSCGIELTLIPKNTIENNLKSNKSCYVYLMRDDANGYYKIGISNTPQYRERTLQSEKPTISLIVAKEFPIRSIAEAFEFALHKTYENKRLRGEWFDLSPEDAEVLKQALS